MTARTFNIDAYQENDSKGKELFKKYLKDRGFHVIDKAEDFGIDLLAYYQGKEFRFEIELNNRKLFTPGNYISFLQRKERMNTKKFYYVIIHVPTMQFVAPVSTLVFKPEYLTTREVDSKDRSGEDVFYHVPLSKLKIRKL